MASDFSSPKPIAQLAYEEMSMLQSFLAQYGYPPGPNDGLWGKKTNAAWLRFTTDNGLDAATMDADLWSQVGGTVAIEEGSIKQGPGGDTSIWDQFGADGGSGNTAAPGTGKDGILDAEEEKRIRELYPAWAHLLDDPDIRKLLIEAVENTFNGAQLNARLESSEWFRTTQASRREFDAANARDPASAEARLQEQILEIENTFGLYGVEMGGQELRELAWDVLRDGTNGSQVLRIVGNLARTQAAARGGDDTGAVQGNLAAVASELGEFARSYHMSYDQSQLGEWAIRIMEGRWTTDAAKATIMQQAKVAFPQLRDQLDQGMTLEDFYAPTKNRLASILELNPNSIDLTSDKWSDFTQLYDDKEGGFRPLSFSELGTKARQMNEYGYTRAAQEKGYGVANALLRTMGAIG